MRTPSPRDDLRFSNTTGILQKKTMWFIGVEVEQETSAPPPKKNRGSAPVMECNNNVSHSYYFYCICIIVVARVRIVSNHKKSTTCYFHSTFFFRL